MAAYLLAMLAVLALCLGLRRLEMVSASVVLLMNWAINTAATAWVSELPPWAVYLGVDYLSALFLLIHLERPPRWHLAIAATYMVQCIAHGAYGASAHDPWANYYYWHVLSKIAWAQLAIIGGWCAVDLYRRWREPTGRGASDIAHNNGSAS